MDDLDQAMLQSLEPFGDSLLPVFDAFEGSLESNFRLLQSALERRDFESGGQVSHRLKGAASSLGFSGIANEAAVIGRACAQSAIVDLEPLRRRMDVAVELLRQEVRPRFEQPQDLFRRK